MNEWEGIEIKIKKILSSCASEYNKMLYTAVWCFHTKYLIIHVLSERKYFLHPDVIWCMIFFKDTSIMVAFSVLVSY